MPKGVRTYGGYLFKASKKIFHATVTNFNEKYIVNDKHDGDDLSLVLTELWSVEYKRAALHVYTFLRNKMYM